jgi:hypothetical protein
MKGLNLIAIFSLVDPMIYFCFGFGDDMELQMISATTLDFKPL